MTKGGTGFLVGRLQRQRTWEKEECKLPVSKPTPSSLNRFVYRQFITAPAGGGSSGEAERAEHLGSGAGFKAKRARKQLQQESRGVCTPLTWKW